MIVASRFDKSNFLAVAEGDALSGTPQLALLMCPILFWGWTICKPGPHALVAVAESALSCLRPVLRPSCVRFPRAPRAV